MEAFTNRIVQKVDYRRSGNFIIGIKLQFEDQTEINLGITNSCCEFSAFYNPDFSSLIGHRIVYLDLIKAEIPFYWVDGTDILKYPEGLRIDGNIMYGCRYDSCEVKVYRLYLENDTHLDLFLFTVSNGYYSGFLEISEQNGHLIQTNISTIVGVVLSPHRTDDFDLKDPGHD